MSSIIKFPTFNTDSTPKQKLISGFGSFTIGDSIDESGFKFGEEDVDYI
jgi:hypothetical protein